MATASHKLATDATLDTLAKNATLDTLAKDTSVQAIGTALTGTGGIKDSLAAIHGDLGSSGGIATKLDTIHGDLGASGGIASKMDAIHGDLGSSGGIASKLDSIHGDISGSGGVTSKLDAIHGDLGNSGTIHGDLEDIHGDLSGQDGIKDTIAAIADAIEALPNATQTAADNANAAAAEARTAIANLGGLVASTYSNSKTYSIDDYCYYNGNLYRCIVKIETAEEWTAAHWTQVKLGNDVSNLKNAFAAEGNGNGTFNLLANASKEKIVRSGGLTIEFEKGVYHIHGTVDSSEEAKFYNLTTDIIQQIIPGVYWFGLYQVKANTDAIVLMSEYTKTTSSNSWALGYQVQNNKGVKWNIGNNVTDILIRFDFYPNVTYDHYLVPVLSRNHTDILADLISEDYKVLTANNQLLNNEQDLLYPYKKGKVFYSTNGIKFDPADGVLTVSGTATANAFYNILHSQNEIPDGITPGESYLAAIYNKNVQNPHVYLDCWYYNASGNLVQFREGLRPFVFTVPEDAKGLLIRIIVKSGAVISEAEEISFGLYPLELPTNEGVLLSGGDIHKIRRSGFYLGTNPSVIPYENVPVAGSFFLTNYEINGNIQIQFVQDWGNANIYVAKRLNDSWTAWQHIGGSGDVTNNYYSEHYNNSYSIECSPTITTDTNNYLASTGDSTDRTGDIQTLLNTTGVCQLGPGDFYVTGVEIPNNGMLRGSGNSTRIVLASSVSTGYAVKLKTYGCVKDLMIDGNPAGTAITTPEEVGTRHGIIFEGTADAETSPVTYYRSAVENCMIRNFTGGGITMNNTGYTSASNLLVTSCFIYWCGAGINIAYFSEFSRFTNVTCQFCLYGCIDNGGNNNFANCDFTGNKTGLLIDNSSNQSRNNCHGTFSACSFHHSDNNYGTAIRILGCSSGEIFTGCQISNGEIVIDDSFGVRFIGANFGDRLPITVTDSVVIVFSDCQYMNTTGSTVVQSGNTHLAFDRCYLKNGTLFDPLH